MPVTAFRNALLGAAAIALAGPALAQTPPAATPATPPASGTTAVTPGNTAAAAAEQPLEAGANSFTEGQARSRIEAAGFSDVSDLTKDDQGIWRGQAMRSGQRIAVGLDFRGHVASGTGAAAPVAATRSNTTTTPAATGANVPDGAPGNPPSTALGRAVDRAQGQTPQPDGTPGNPPGTAVGRALGTSPSAPTAPAR